MARQRAGMSQAETAKLIDLIPSVLDQYESGKRQIEAPILERLARLYGVSSRSLFEGEMSSSEWETNVRQCGENFSAESKAGLGRLIQTVNTLETLYYLNNSLIGVNRSRFGRSRHGNPSC